MRLLSGRNQNNRIKDSKERKIFKSKTEVVTIILMAALFACMGFFMICVNSLEYINLTFNSIDDVSTNLQRLVRMEVTDEPNDEIIEEINELLELLTEQQETIHSFVGMGGSDICFKYLANTSSSWEQLKEEIYKAREIGWENTRIILIAETVYYNMNTVAEEMGDHFDVCSTQLRHLQYTMCILMFIVIVLWGSRIVQYIADAQNREELLEMAYMDTLTNMSNRAGCDKILGEKDVIDNESVIMIFDLNNLKVINDTLGHIYGNMLLQDFANVLREGLQISAEAKKIFLGRYGGDEFILYLENEQILDLERYIEEVNILTAMANKKNKEFQISYAVGYARASEFKEIHSITELLEQADKKMYEHKVKVKSEI